jgi:hypothetical protein
MYGKWIVCARLSDGQTLFQLQSFCEEFPAKLEVNFERQVCERINETYRKATYPETTMAMWIALEAMKGFHRTIRDELVYSDTGQPGFAYNMSFLCFWLLRESILTGNCLVYEPLFGRFAKYREFSPSKIQEMGNETTKYLAGCCKDFVWISPDPAGSHKWVDFRHPNAHDFLHTQTMQDLIVNDVPPPFSNQISGGNR